MLQGGLNSLRSAHARRSSIVLAGLIVSLCASMPVTLRGQTTPATSPPSSIKTVTVNFDDRSAAGVLPFDEPFRIQAQNVGEDVVAGGVRFGPLPRGMKCEASLDTLRPKKPERIDGFLVKANSKNELHVLSTDQFIVPNRLQCFVFELDHKMPPELRAQIRTMYDQLGAQATDSRPDPAAVESGLQSIQRQVCDALKAFAASKKMGLKEPCDSGSGAALARALTQERTRAFVKILDAQDNKKRQMDTYCQVRKDAVDALATLQRGYFGRVLEKMHEARLTKPAVRALIAEHAVAFRELRGTKRSANLRADDECAEDHAEGLLEHMTPADLAGHEKELDAVIAELETMKPMFESLLASDAKLATELGESARNVALDAERVSAIAADFRGVKAVLEEVKTILAARETALNTLAARDDLLNLSTVTLVGSSIVPYTDRAKLYISADVGLGSAFEIQETFGYAGVNIYTRAINKNAQLDWSRLDLDWWRKRVSGMVGITIQDVERAGEFKGTFGKKAVVGALGFRVLESVRVSAGGMLINSTLSYSHRR